MEKVNVRMRLHVIFDDSCTDIAIFKANVVVRWVAVDVSLNSYGSICICAERLSEVQPNWFFCSLY